MPNAESPIDRPLYNSRIIQAYLQLIRKKYPRINISNLLRDAGMKPYEVDDQGHWFSQRQIDRFYERLVRLTGNKRIAREAGRFAASPESIGVMRQYVLGLVTPVSAYDLIGKSSANFTRSSKYESRRIAANKVEITVTPYEGVIEKPFQCENRQGFFEAVLTIFNSRPPLIEHSECLFKGASVCRYVISWEKSFFDYFRLFKNYSILVLLLIGVVAPFLFPFQTVASIIGFLVAALFGIALTGSRLNARQLGEAIQNLQESSTQLVEQIQVNYNNTLVTREIGQVVNRQTNIDDVLEDIVGILQKCLDYDRGMIMLADKEKNRLFFKAGYGYTSEQHLFLRKISFHLNKPDSRGIFVVSFREQKPFLINDIDEIEETLSHRSLDFARRMGVQSFICCPIICDNESLGVVAVDNIRSKRLLVQSDMSLLMGISQVIGISVRHSEHLEAREKQLKSVLQVMVSTIDARDPVTKGHSEWVAEFSAGICDEMGLDREFREMVRVAALLHDYGKIGIPDSMLKKADKLTQNEYEYVKCHAEKTIEILEQIHFEGGLCQVPEIAGAHHERIDGSGYPRGLKGDEIPLGARIIAVADYFEALTASRYYNEPLPPKKAMEMLIEKSGTFFEDRIVDAFIRYYRRSYTMKNGQQQVNLWGR